MFFNLKGQPLQANITEISRDVFSSLHCVIKLTWFLNGVGFNFGFAFIVNNE